MLGAGAVEAGSNVTDEHLRNYIRTYNPEAERGREGEIERQGKERVVCCGVKWAFENFKAGFK